MKILADKLNRYDKDGLLRDSILLLFFTHSISVANLLFHVVMGHTLTKGEYGILVPMLGVFLTFATPMLAMQNTIAHFSGHLKNEGNLGDIRRLVWHWVRWIAAIALPLLILALIFHSFWARVFNLDSSLPFVVSCFTISASVILPIFAGALQGVQKFVWMSATQVGWGIVRLVLGSVLVWFVAPLALCGLSAHFIGVLVSIAIGLYALHRFIPRASESSGPLEKTNQYFLFSVVALFSFSVLMNWDVVLVKIFFPEEADYGTYSQASTIARTLIFICQPITLALFPKVVSRGESSRTHFVTLCKGLVLSSALIATSVVLCMVLPKIPLLVLYGEGDPSQQTIQLLRGVVVAMAPLGITMMLTNFELAQRRFRVLLPLLFCAAILIGGIALFHDSLFDVIKVLSVASYLSIAATVTLVLQGAYRQSKAARQ